MEDDSVHRILNEVKVASLATVRQTGAPHLAPVSFVLFNHYFYFTSKENSIKCRNIRGNKRVALSIIGSSEAVLIEGEASIIGPREASMTPEIAQAFLEKYARPRRESEGSVLVRVKPVRILLGKLGRRQRPVKSERG
jgi:nitroimidazol reductase NimA-like FMN-containing flavoprotein (pyridoxamine 5'-phosphate oxidase superfamily)